MTCSDVHTKHTFCTFCVHRPVAACPRTILTAAASDESRTHSPAAVWLPETAAASCGGDDTISISIAESSTEGAVCGPLPFGCSSCRHEKVPLTPSIQNNGPVEMAVWTQHTDIKPHQT